MLLKFKDLWKKIIIIIMVLLISTSTFAKPQKTDAFVLELWMLGVMATMLVGGGIVFTSEPTQAFLTDTFYSLSEEVQQGIANAESLGTAFYMVGINEYKKFMDDIYSLFGISSLSAGSAVLFPNEYPKLDVTIPSGETKFSDTQKQYYQHGYLINSLGQMNVSTYYDAVARNVTGTSNALANIWVHSELTNSIQLIYKRIYDSNLKQYAPFKVTQTIEFIPFGANDMVLASVIRCLYGCTPNSGVSLNYNGAHAKTLYSKAVDSDIPFNSLLTMSFLLANGFSLTSNMTLDLPLPMPKPWEDLDENEKDEALKDGFANHNGKLILGGAAAAIGSAIGTLTPPLVRDVPKDGSWLDDLTDEDINNIGLAGVIAALAQLINSLVKKITDTFDKPSPSPGNIDLLKTTIMMKVPCMTEFTGAFEQIMELQGETPVHTFTLFGKEYSFEYYKLFEGFIHVSSYIKQFFNFILWFLFLRGGIRRITSTLSGGTTEGNDQ